MAGSGNNHPILRTLMGVGGSVLGALTGNPLVGKGISMAGGKLMDHYSNPNTGVMPPSV
jgi:hypothetical protein